MNTYEKLVYLASNPFDKNVLLNQLSNESPRSYQVVLKMLDIDFKKDMMAYQTSIDMRQACETKVVGI